MRIAILKIGVVVAMCVVSCVFPQVIPAQYYYDLEENPLIGKSLPESKIKNLKGNKVSLADYIKGSRTIFFFWATWCPHCRETIEGLAQKKNFFRQSRVNLVLVNVGETQKIAKKFIDRNNIGYEVLIGDEDALADDLALIGVPTFFFVNESGTIQDVRHSYPEKLDEIFKQ